MKHFYLEQKWIASFGVFGTFFGEVTEVSDEGECGVVVITDSCGNEIDIYTGSSAAFQSSGEWEPT